MPITNTLETTRRLEQAGFPAKQADVLSGLFEDTAKTTQQDLKAFIVEQLAAFEVRIEARFAQSEAKMDARASQTESRLLREMRQQVIWIFGAEIALAGIILGAAKLLFG
jgi:hypothetical protein